MFDALALNDTGRLQDHDVVGRKPQLVPEPPALILVNYRRILEIDDIGNDGGRDSGAQGQFLLGRRIDHHMFDAGQIGRKGHAQIITGGVDCITGAFPIKVVVVADGGDLGFGNHLGQGYAQRDVHGYGQGIFDHQQIDAESLDKLAQLDFEDRF